ncbi:MAG: peptidoglycan DD-metalloendopeptidase family protein, partial [Tissierellia bacterium]|nr:peptidoglycan DD-metalloendopeptidase family protein [Tissierellia bacterium]
NDGVIDRYDADFRDSKVMTYGDLDEREDERVETEFHEYKPIPKDSINFKSSSEQKVNVKETLSKASFLTKDPKEIVDKSSERLKKQKRKQVQTFQKGDKKDRLIMEEMKATDDEKSLNLKEVLKNDVDLKELKEKRQEPEVDFSLEGRDKKTDNQMSRGKKGNLKDSIQTLKEKKNLKKDPLAEKGEPHEGESGSDVKKRSKTKKDAKQKETEKQQSSETDKKEEKEKSESKKQKKQSKLLFEEEEKESKYHGTKEGALLKKAVISGAVMASALAKKSIHTEDDDNSGLEALRGAKTTSIKARRGMKRLQMKREGRRVKKVSKRREKFRKNSMSEPNATMGKKAKKEFQKKKQQRNYAKTIRKKQKKVFGGLKEKIGALWHSIRNSSKRSIAPIVIILLLLLGLMVGMQSCSAIMLGGLGAITGSSYQADDLEITGADLEYTRLEANLLKTIEDMEKDHPGYDEYRYNLSSVGHDPHELIAYLTALFQDFRLEEVRSEIEAVFQAQYTLTTQEIIERYTTTHRYKDPHTGQIYTVEQEHEKKILEITLNSKPLDSVLKSRMDEDQKEIYDVLMETKGNFMTFPSPIEGEWKTAITSMFGYRVHPIDKTVKLHTGIDIGGAEGTALKAVFDGVVVEKAFDSSGYGHYVVIEDKNGGQALYAHCSSVDVSIGEEVKTEQVIAKMGSTGKSTGSHLHFELKDKDGNHLNPYFYLHSKVDKLPSSASTYYNGYTGEYGNPGIAFDDETVRRLFAEAEKHIGKAYVYGAVGPNNFDCSSFVCWSFRVSGVRPDMYRTTAQEIFNKCTPITREEAKAGDLVFFTGTYDAKRPVSHVGLYAGEGMMLHAGDPIQYASIDTNYWRNHFYAFGRLR